ncbi:MAG: GGDEF domain-containing protein [Gammaproteobacteria bacterium]|nr:GGDEF domain-containing protein [Gammaproteobacteria bacterium]
MMAASKTTLINARQRFDNNTDDEIKAEIIGHKNLSEFVSRVHEFLDFYQLFDTFIDELRAVVPCDSIEYEDKTTDTTLINGEVAKHLCEYNINYEGLSLGCIRISRDTEILENEFVLIETMLAGLTLPLRNALRYLQVINFSQRDLMAGLNNVSYSNEIVDLEIERSIHYKDPYSLLIFNLDDFETINSQLGSKAGYTIIREIATRIQHKACSRDVVYGNSGDDLLMFLPDTNKQEATLLAKKIKDLVLTETFVFSDTTISFSLNMGVITVTYDAAAVSLIDRIDTTVCYENISGKERNNSESSTKYLHRLKKSPRQTDSFSDNH